MWRRSKPQELSAPPKPDARTFVIGDIHGCADQLNRALAEIDARDPGKDAMIVCVGDYLDRGPDSAGVLNRLRKLSIEQPDRITCLIGNHERMMIDFLSKPNSATARWLNAGGQETLLSFGIGHPAGNDGSERQKWLASELSRKLGEPTIRWIKGMPLIWQSGTLAAVHAYTDVRRAIDQQEESALLWARSPKLPRPRSDGIWIVHGHTVVSDPSAAHGHIAIDTGAWRGGALTVAEFNGGMPEFLSF